MSNQKTEQFLTDLRNSLLNDTFISVSLGAYRGEEPDLKGIQAKRILIKNVDKLSFTYRYKKRDIVKNYDWEEGIELIRGFLQSDFTSAALFTEDKDLQWQNQNGRLHLHSIKPSKSKPVSITHDREKQREITSDGKIYLHLLNITDKTGQVLKNAQDKYRQINRYIELLKGDIEKVSPKGPLKVADMGSGKGYLTFALYDYLSNVAGRDVEITGVEYRQDMVDLCNRFAAQSGFDHLSFVEGTIEGFETDGLDVLIALHACDTATDDAIAKGIAADAQLIVVAPCCHKQIRNQIEAGKAKNEVTFLTRHGVFMERQAEMVTDGLRALILEYFGYSTKVFEFVSDVHTPKNVMIVGVKTRQKDDRKAQILRQINEIKQNFGIGYHHLERRTGLEQL